MIPVPDEVVREVVRDLREYHGYLRHDNGVGAPRAQENAELLEDLLEGDRPDLTELARETSHARTDDIQVWSTDLERVVYQTMTGEEIELEEYTGEVD